MTRSIGTDVVSMRLHMPRLGRQNDTKKTQTTKNVRMTSTMRGAVVGRNGFIKLETRHLVSYKMDRLVKIVSYEFDRIEFGGRC